jgi:hypothetical protein
MTAKKSQSQKKQSSKEMHKHDAAADEQMSVNSWICYWDKDTKWEKNSVVMEGALLLGRLLDRQLVQYAMRKEGRGRVISVPTERITIFNYSSRDWRTLP